MGLFSEVIADAGRRRAVVHDATVVLDEEVASKSGLSGLAIKAAFAMVKAVKPGIIPETCEGLMPDFAKALDPLLAQCPAEQKVAAYLMSREQDVVQALLGVTDARAQRTTHQTLLKAYQRLRPSAEKQVAAGLPRLSRLVEKHVATLPLPAPAASPGV